LVIYKVGHFLSFFLEQLLEFGVFIKQCPPGVFVEVLDKIEKGYVWTLLIWGL
jgi:hypothetical protein